MNQEKPIKVHVAGGDSWKERELVVDTIAAAMHDRGFNKVRPLNSAGNINSVETPRTVWEAVQCLSPNLVDREVIIDPGYDNKHPEAGGPRNGSFVELPHVGRSVYDPDRRPNVGSRWLDNRPVPDADRIPGIHTAARTVGTNYGAILDVRNSERPGKLIEAIEKEFDEEVVHVGIIATTTTSALRAVEQALMAQPNAHVTVSMTDGLLPNLMSTKNSQFFGDRPEAVVNAALPSKIGAIESEMRRYGNPETFAIDPQDDGMVNITMQPRTKGEADKLYSAIMSGPSKRLPAAAYDPLMRAMEQATDELEEGWLTKDDFGKPLNTDPNHSEIVQLIQSNMRRAKPIDNNLIVEHVAKEAADNALQRADEHLARARHSIEQAKKLDKPGLQEEVTQMVKTNMQASGGYDGMSDTAVEELASVAVAKGFQNAKNKLAAQRGEYIPPVEDDVEAEIKKVKERTKIATKRIKERTAP